MVSEIYIGSTNPAKVRAVEKVFLPPAVVVPRDVPSSVSPQPRSDEETMLGAINRAKYLIEYTDASVAIGLEGGVVENEAGMLLCNWGALIAKKNGIYTAGGARIYLPKDIAEEIRTGRELGEVIDEWTGRNNIRKKEGTIGILTYGEIDRIEMFKHIVKLLYGQWKFDIERKKG
ncbi:inosine/xanthosine triphosphatase [Evansella vedderi]|uniref:inosine/xanthosine triphosphatase n=1 Tax=Evansella vedderi TaxID=38282 RepID=A0ABT9ZUR1_9BACI|nr:DUF84 family protein [Evansella vedderi]MDQ0254983.1 inosine/xanthosine triphosphatase [Evansella vedderi]